MLSFITLLGFNPTLFKRGVIDWAPTLYDSAFPNLFNPVLIFPIALLTFPTALLILFPIFVLRFVSLQ